MHYISWFVICVVSCEIWMEEWYLRYEIFIEKLDFIK